MTTVCFYSRSSTFLVHSWLVFTEHYPNHSPCQCCWVSVTAVFSAHSISECLQNQSVNGRCRFDTRMTRTTLLQRTASDADASVPAPQASPSRVPASQASPSSVPAPQASPSRVPVPQASPQSVPAPQASPSSMPAPQASPSSVPAPQASPSSVPAPQASPSSVDLLTTQLTALQHQMEVMQDVVLGLAYSIHSPARVTPDFIDPAETIVTQPHAEPNITSAVDQHVSVGATLDSVGLSAQQNVSTGEQQTFSLPGNSSSFSSVPLGALVDSKLKAKIWTRQYVDLALLTGDSSARYSVVLDTGAESSSWHLKEEPLKIDTIGSSTEAFLIYMAIYVDRFPSEVSQMLNTCNLSVAWLPVEIILCFCTTTGISGNWAQQMP